MTSKEAHGRAGWKSANPFRGVQPIVCEKRTPDGRLDLSGLQPPKMITTLDEVYTWWFRDHPSAQTSSWEELSLWLTARGWRLRAKTW